MKKILIVDDEPLMLKFASRALQNRYDIILASSGSEAVSLFEQEKPDMILSDLMMPVMSGYELYDIIRKKSSADIPFIFMTANESEEDKNIGFEKGAVDYIKKPFKADLLLGSVEKIFNETASENNTSSLDMEAEKNKLPEWLFDEAAIDVKKGLNNCGSAEAYLEALDIFLANISDNSAEIDKFFSTNNITDYTIRVHALKSTSKLIGAEQLSQTAKALEVAGHNNDLDFIKREHETFLRDYKHFQKYSLSDNSDSKKEKLSSEMMNDACATLLEYAALEDYTSAEVIMKQLTDYEITPSDRKLIMSIKKAMFRLDWDEMKRIITARTS